MKSNEKRDFVEKKNPTEIFWSHISDALCDGEILLHVIHTYINSYRSSIDDHSQTAIAIDEKKSWKEIKDCAEKEGLVEFSEALTFIDGVLK